MTDPSISQEEEANEERAARGEDAQRDGGILGTIERALSFMRDQEDEPETGEEIDRRRRANDEAQLV
ncbi:MAG TPA: hypothetical protein VKB09_06770 [Thermomicrobiales bacterium]|nr:hypothetical protein [Thermomicrobiales bacterium]